jgi:hypothetical protein
VVLVAFTAACGSTDNNKAGSTSTSAGGASSSSSSSPVTTTPPTGSGSTTPVSVAPTQPAAHLTAVRAARQDSVDRVVLEFADRVPGYSISYKQKPIMNTEGNPVALAGSTALVVHMQAASGFNQASGQSTYTGPKELKPAGTRAVQDVAQVEDFEAVLSWAVGLNAEAPFRVSTLASPPRLVIEVVS